MSCSDYKNLKEAYLDNTNMMVERFNFILSDLRNVQAQVGQVQAQAQAQAQVQAQAQANLNKTVQEKFYKKREKGHTNKPLYLVSNTPTKTLNDGKLIRTDEVVPSDNAFRGFIIIQDRLDESSFEYPIYDIQGEFYNPKNKKDVTEEIKNIYNKFKIYPEVKNNKGYPENAETILVDPNTKKHRIDQFTNKPYEIPNQNIIYKKVPMELYSFRVGEPW